jgi:hypothetical protein
MSVANVNPLRAVPVRPSVKRIRQAVVAVAVVAVAACGSTVTPSPSPLPASVPPDGTPSASAPTDDPNALLTAPWRPAPLPVDPNLVTAVELACKNPAETDLKAAIENAPVALVDARGDSLVSVILADEHVAYECRVSVEVLGGVATATIIEPPSRLVPDATAPIEDDSIRIISHNRVDEDRGSRTIAVGRVGSAADKVMVAFGDQSEVEASMGNGWFMAWWPGINQVGAIVAVDRRSVAISGVEDPATEVEGRVAPATWWLDPVAAPLSAEATSIPALARERECASGQPPGDRLLDPVVFTSDDAILVNIWVRRQQGGGDCQANPAVPVEIMLTEPVGDRRLLDGSEIPPRDASVPPG